MCIPDHNGVYQSNRCGCPFVTDFGCESSLSSVVTKLLLVSASLLLLYSTSVTPLLFEAVALLLAMTKSTTISEKGRSKLGTELYDEMYTL